MFDFNPGLYRTTRSGTGYFLYMEPFGFAFAEMIDDPVLAEKYVFEALYEFFKTRGNKNSRP